MPHRQDPPTLRESEPTAEPTAPQVRIPTTGTLGIFDSGVGGFSVLRHLLTEIPSANTLYFADQAHIPYGPRPPSEVQRYAEAITRFLHTNGAELIVVACNAASAAALDTLRATFPDMPFVGMEPAVKPAAQTTRSGRAPSTAIAMPISWRATATAFRSTKTHVRDSSSSLKPELWPNRKPMPC